MVCCIRQVNPRAKTDALDFGTLLIPTRGGLDLHFGNTFYMTKYRLTFPASFNINMPHFYDEEHTRQ